MRNLGSFSSPYVALGVSVPMVKLPYLGLAGPDLDFLPLLP